MAAVVSTRLSILLDAGSVAVTASELRQHLAAKHSVPAQAVQLFHVTPITMCSDSDMSQLSPHTAAIVEGSTMQSFYKLIGLSSVCMYVCICASSLSVVRGWLIAVCLPCPRMHARNNSLGHALIGKRTVVVQV
jgi:hypothetical protein